mgnify:CR=1
MNYLQAIEHLAEVQEKRCAVLQYLVSKLYDHTEPMSEESKSLSDLADEMEVKLGIVHALEEMQDAFKLDKIRDKIQNNFKKDRVSDIKKLIDGLIENYEQGAWGL